MPWAGPKIRYVIPATPIDPHIASLDAVDESLRAELSVVRRNLEQGRRLQPFVKVLEADNRAVFGSDLLRDLELGVSIQPECCRRQGDIT